MACAKPSDCAPCNKCPDTPAPVMPRCNVVLTDGSYTNATVVVENGCIVSLSRGNAPLYQPDSCCGDGGTGSGNGNDGLPGAMGPPGDDATLAIGVVSSLAPGVAPTVVNVGTPTHAILNIGIPRGATGADAPIVPGATDNSVGFDIQNGIIKTLPFTWPPVMGILPPTVFGAGITLTMLEDPNNGVVSVVLDASGLIAFYDAENLAQQTMINDLLARVAVLEGGP